VLKGCEKENITELLSPLTPMERMLKIKWQMRDVYDTNAVFDFSQDHIFAIHNHSRKLHKISIAEGKVVGTSSFELAKNVYSQAVVDFKNRMWFVDIFQNLVAIDLTNMKFVGIVKKPRIDG
jgi:hypothetical protein